MNFVTLRHMDQPAIVVASDFAPPSTNALFANIPGKGRVRSKRYLEWLNAAGWDANGRGHVSGPFEISILINALTRRKGRDLDNYIKPILDLMVKHGIVQDDSLCERATISWGDTGSKAWSLVIRPMSWETLP